jgi:hypothetical protein
MRSWRGKKPYRGLTDDEVEARYTRDEFPSLDGMSIGPAIRGFWHEACENTNQIVEVLQESLQE